MAELVRHLAAKTHGLKNTYMQLDSGLLVPHPIYFFSDSCPHAIGNIRAVVKCATDSVGVDLVGISKEEKKYVRVMTKLGREKNLDSVVNTCRYVIDEVLAIASPKDAFGVVQTQFKGQFDDAYVTFFNARNLRELFRLVSQRHFDYTAKKPTGTLAPLLSFWEGLQSEYNTFLEAHPEQYDILERYDT
ncbi:TPA: hypothetical protein HA251_06375 [Candidatus Woesearchaeota archaeon]|nr:hypothetical protein [Candidatus Woesearchaeota archaeon]